MDLHRIKHVCKLVRRDQPQEMWKQIRQDLASLFVIVLVIFGAYWMATSMVTACPAKNASAYLSGFDSFCHLMRALNGNRPI